VFDGRPAGPGVLLIPSHRGCTSFCTAASDRPCRKSPGRAMHGDLHGARTPVQHAGGNCNLQVEDDASIGRLKTLTQGRAAE
jgi:hypothetical protein